MALVGGLEAPPGRIMGHAGAWAAPGEPDAETKYRALERAGAVMVNHPEKFGEEMKSLFTNQSSRPGTNVRVCFSESDLTYTDIPTVNVQDQLTKTRVSYYETSCANLETDLSTQA